MTTPGLEPDALTALLNYNFPGNVRELENILERALALSDGGLHFAYRPAADAVQPRGRGRYRRHSDRRYLSAAGLRTGWNGRRLSMRWKKPASTAPPPPSCSASPSAQCVTGWSGWASTSSLSSRLQRFACTPPTTAATTTAASRRYLSGGRFGFLLGGVQLYLESITILPGSRATYWMPIWRITLLDLRQQRRGS